MISAALLLAGAGLFLLGLAAVLWVYRWPR